MEQNIRPQDSTGHSKTASRKVLRKKKRRQRLMILLAITFFLGFVIGLLVGANQKETIEFIMSSTRSGSKEGTFENLPWNLTLVNFENPLEKDFEPEELAEVNNGYIADSRMTEAAKEMITAAAGEDVHILVLSAYRDYEYQTDLYNNKVQRLQQENGYSVDKARVEAATVVAYPGTSEHQLGLALDLVDSSHTVLDESQENTAAYQWLKEHCDEYGFIVRYPNGKTDITGIIYEPWHFRYVGVEAAKEIMGEDITLEEYLEEHYKE